MFSNSIIWFILYSHKWVYFCQFLKEMWIWNITFLNSVYYYGTYFSSIILHSFELNLFTKLLVILASFKNLMGQSLDVQFFSFDCCGSLITSTWEDLFSWIIITGSWKVVLSGISICFISGGKLFCRLFGYLTSTSCWTGIPTTTTSPLTLRWCCCARWRTLLALLLLKCTHTQPTAQIIIVTTERIVTAIPVISVEDKDEGW